MTFNESCIAIESYTNETIEKTNEILSNMYAIESQFNMGIAFEAEGTTKTSFLTKIKEKIKWLGGKIAEIFRRAGDFFTKIFNKISGRDKLMYNSTLVKSQANFIKEAIKKTKNDANEGTILESFMDDFSDSESLFIAVEADTMDKKDKKFLRDATKLSQTMGERIKESQKFAASIIDKYKVSGFTPESISLSRGMKANMSVADAAKTLKQALFETKKEIEKEYSDLKKSANKGDEKDIVKMCTKQLKKTTKLLNLASTVMTFMRTGKITSLKESKYE